MTTTYRPLYPPHESDSSLPYYMASRLNEWAYRLHEADRDFGVPLADTDNGSEYVNGSMYAWDWDVFPSPAMKPTRTPVPEAWRTAQRVLVAVIIAVVVVVIAYGQGIR